MECPNCSGVGHHTWPIHHPDCTDTTCSYLCPIPYAELCNACGGLGRMEVTK